MDVGEFIVPVPYVKQVKVCNHFVIYILYSLCVSNVAFPASFHCLLVIYVITSSPCVYALILLALLA